MTEGTREVKRYELAPLQGLPIMEPPGVRWQDYAALQASEARLKERNALLEEVLLRADELTELLVTEHEELLCVCDSGDRESGLAPCRCEMHTLEEAVADAKAECSLGHTAYLRDGEPCPKCAVPCPDCHDGSVEVHGSSGEHGDRWQEACPECHGFGKLMPAALKGDE